MGLHSEIKNAFWTVAILVSFGALSVVLGSEKPEQVRTPAATSSVIRFKLADASRVSILIFDAEDHVVRHLLLAEKLPAGRHEISWDGQADALAGSAPKPVPPGIYHWRGLAFSGPAAKLVGFAGTSAREPWPNPDPTAGWGGTGGVPSSVAADARTVFLGWSHAENGRCLAACGPAGRVRWTFDPGMPSGVKMLAVEDGVVYVLGGPTGVAEEGGSIFKLDAETGARIPWFGRAPESEKFLEISALWPTQSRAKPECATAFAVSHGRIFLTFSQDQFLTVLDAHSGAYLQTLVGAPPGLIAVASTRTESPTAPAKLVDADFLLITMPRGLLSKALFLHDPFYLLSGDITALAGDERVTALSLIGDAGAHFRHTIFLGLAPPRLQVQSRSVLRADQPFWTGGRLGGRDDLGPWRADALGPITGVALDARGQLWAAEAETFPRRFSVWNPQPPATLPIREFFGPPEHAAACVIDPLDPKILVGDGCEWRVDGAAGHAKCLGVISREGSQNVRFGIGKNGHVYLALNPAGSTARVLKIFERVEEGDYRFRAQIFSSDESGRAAEPASASGELTAATHTTFWSDANGDGKEQPEELQIFPGAWPLSASGVTPDLTLSGGRRVFSVNGWTACGAPFYAPAGSDLWPLAGQLSEDGQALLSAAESGELRYFLKGKPAPEWTFFDRALCAKDSAESGAVFQVIGSVKLPAPLGNVWSLAAADGRWHFFNEEGFYLGALFSSVNRAAGLPKKIVAGADLSALHSGANPKGDLGSLTRAADGKIYLGFGETAHLAAELTGLSAGQILPGGLLTCPAP